MDKQTNKIGQQQPANNTVCKRGRDTDKKWAGEKKPSYFNLFNAIGLSLYARTNPGLDSKIYKVFMYIENLCAYREEIGMLTKVFMSYEVMGIALKGSLQSCSKLFKLYSNKCN